MSEFQSSWTGAISGYDVHVVGQDVAGPQPFTLPSGLTVVTENPLPALQEACQALQIELLVSRIAAISGDRARKDSSVTELLQRNAINPESVLRDYQLALILRLALENAGHSRTHAATLLDLARLCKMAAASLSECDNDEASPESILIRFAYQQFWDQESLAEWPRGLLIWREMNNLLDESNRFDVNRAFGQYNSGLTLDSFIFFSFALYALAVGQPGSSFDVSSFTRSPDFRMSADEVRTFLDLISVTVDEFEQRTKDPNVYIDGYGIYNLNPLLRWPAIKGRDGRVTVPIPRLLLQRVTTGAYYDFLQMLPGKERDRFGNFWGNAFQEYIGRLLKSTPGIGNVESAQTLRPSGPVCDWAITDAEGSALIECKTRGLGIKSKVTGQTQNIRTELLSHIDGSSLPYGFMQLAESVAALRESLPNPVSPLLVTLDDVWFGNDDRFPFQDVIREGAEKLTQTKLPSFGLYSVSDIESLCRAVEFSGCRVSTVLQAKTNSVETSRLELRHFIRRLFNPPNQPVALHREVLDKRMSDLIAPFRPQD